MTRSDRCAAAADAAVVAGRGRPRPDRLRRHGRGWRLRAARSSRRTSGRRRTRWPPGGQLEIVNANGVDRGRRRPTATSVEVVAERTARATTTEAAKELLQKVRDRASRSRRTGCRLETSVPSARSGGSAEVQFAVKVPRSAARSTRQHERRRSVVAGAQGAVRAEATNGSVTGRGLTGAVDASTTNGGVDDRGGHGGADGIKARDDQRRRPADAAGERAGGPAGELRQRRRQRQRT